MSDKEVPFFNPTDVFGLGGNWIQQDNNLQESISRAQGLKADGDESASQTHDGKEAGSVTYEDHSAAGELVLPNVGSVAGGYHIDSVQVVYSPTGWPKLTINAHQHDTNPHVDGDLNEFTPTVTLPAQFGVPRALAPTIFSITDDECGVSGMTYNLACTHQDEGNGVGNHLAGQNRDGVETLSVDFIKTPDVVTVDSNWTEMSDGSPKSNTGAETASMGWERHIAREVVA